MSREELLDRISINPEICFGKPCIRGHRIWVSLILDFLASGASVDEILRDYPQLEEADIMACIAYGAEMAPGTFRGYSTPNQTLKFKLDENPCPDCARLFIDAGHDSTTVLVQGLAGTSDSDLIMHCRAEGRALVTLDLDFANPLVFKPSAHHGIAVLRPC